MTDSPDALAEKIIRARTVGGTPPGRYLTKFRSVGELLRHRAESSPDRPSLVFYPDAGEREAMTRAEVHAKVRRTARFLREHGIGRGTRVATVAHNHSDTVIQYLACWSVGAVVVPVNVGEDDRRIAYILSDSDARLAFVRAEYLSRILALIPRLPHEIAIVVCGNGRAADAAGRPGALFGEIIGSGPEDPGDPAVSPEDEALIVYTSGTTGNPKGVVLLQYNLLVDAMAIAEWHSLSAGDVMMCVLPVHHVNGIVVTLMTPLWYDGTVVLNQKFHTDRFFPTIAREGVNVVSVVPTLLQFLLHADPGRSGLDLGRFRHIICGAGPLTCELAAGFEEKFGIPIIHGYGLSETTCYSCFLPSDLGPDEHASWLRDHGFPSIGVPLPVNEMDIHDAEGRSAGEGTRGEIVIRGHNVMRGYFNNPEANAHTFAHGWFRSGDEGFYRKDALGRKFFFITGRLKELIIRGGINISPFEIDEVLMNVPGVKAGLAVGFENDWYGEEVGAYIQRKPGSEVTETDVLAECRKMFPFAKCPKVVLFGDEVPVTSTGKYQRNRLRHLFTPWKSVQFHEGRVSR